MSSSHWLTKQVLIRLPGAVQGFYVGPNVYVDEETYALISNKSVIGEPPKEESKTVSSSDKRKKAASDKKKAEAVEKRRKNAEARTAAVQKAAELASKAADASIKGDGA